MLSNIIVLLSFALMQYVFLKYAIHPFVRKSLLIVLILGAVAFAVFFDKSNSIFGMFIMLYYYGFKLIAAFLGLLLAKLIYFYSEK